MSKKPTWMDVLILSLFAIFMTFRPDYLHDELNLFELSLYLPGINAIFHGQVPFRDFFHLRGPLELYIPALMMSLFGKNIAVLSTYFYVGTVLGLIICVFIAAQLYHRRLFLYLMVPILIARTFPRVVFTFWGGLRFTWGLLALFFVIRFLKKEKRIWIFLAGIASALGFLTSVEIGLCSVVGFLAAMIVSFILKVQDRKLIIKALGVYTLGFFGVVGPYLGYLLNTHAVVAFWDSMYSVVVNMQKVIDSHLVSIYPRNFKEAVVAMVNPQCKNFRHMTPSYVYIFLLIYLGWRMKSKKFDRADLCLVCLGVYGFIMYNIAFRGIWAAQFEMSLQPEKILWFYVLEIFFLFLLDHNNKAFSYTKKKDPDFEKESRISRWMKRYSIYLFCLVLIGSSLGYAIQRYNHRFFVFQLFKDAFRKNPQKVKSLASLESYRALTIPRAQGMEVPSRQADEIETIVTFVTKESAPNDVVVMYPDSGIYNFLFDRPFLNRFPVAIFSWLNERWHKEFIDSFKVRKPKFVIIPQKFPDLWRVVHLTPVKNREKYQEVMDIVRSNYVLEKTTPLSYIYRIKKGAFNGDE